MNKEILNTAYDMYMKFGVKRMSMAELALRLGLSAKRLHDEVGCRTELLERVVQELVSRLNAGVKRKFLAGNDPLEKLLGVYSFVLNAFYNINPSFMYDLERQHKDIHRKLIEFGDNELRLLVCRLINDGKAAGLFRDDVAAESLYRVQVEKIRYLIESPEGRASNDDFSIKTMLLINDIRGMCTLEGHKALDAGFQDIMDQK